jgi:adenylate cyclase
VARPCSNGAVIPLGRLSLAKPGAGYQTGGMGRAQRLRIWLGQRDNALAVLIGLGAMLAVVGLQWADFRLLRIPSLQLFDLYQTAAPRDYGDPPVKVVDIDEESIERLGQWPWPRTDIARLIDRLAEAGAAVIAFDITFAEPDRTSPDQIAAMLERQELDPSLTARLASLPANDATLADSIASAPVVNGYFLLRTPSVPSYEPPVGLALAGTMPAAVPVFAGTIAPLPMLDERAAGAGFLTKAEDDDGITRRVPLVARLGDKLVPALSLEALRVAQQAGTIMVRASDASGEAGKAAGAVVSIRNGEIDIPTTAAGELWIWATRPAPQRSIPAWRILADDADPAALAELVEGRIIFVGTSASGLRDLVTNPRGEREPGVFMHASSAEQMIAGQFLIRPDWAAGMETALVIIFGAGLALLLPRMGAVIGAVAGAALMGGAAAGSWLAFRHYGFLLDPTYLMAALLAVYLLQTIFAYNREERRRAYIHQAFDRYLSPDLVRQIAANPGKLELGGEERDMSVLFCDIRGFSRISEQLEPQQLIEFLIAFLTPMCEELLERQATVDKFIGDAILAFWNAPLDDPLHHRNAARSALAMLERLQSLNQEYEGSDNPAWPGQVEIGIGINSGLCCVGNMGSRQRLSYSLIGDTVNLASRLEGLSKTYGVPIIIGNAVAEQLDGFAVIELDRVRVVGRRAPEVIHALLGDEQMAERAEFRALATSQQALLAAYRAQDWARVDRLGAAHRAACEVMGLRALADLFQQRARALSRQPVRPDWGGVYEATSK